MIYSSWCLIYALREIGHIVVLRSDLESTLGFNVGTGEDVVLCGENEKFWMEDKIGNPKRSSPLGFRAPKCRNPISIAFLFQSLNYGVYIVNNVSYLIRKKFRRIAN